ncbi:MAG: tetratricopeptide repeat protein [Acidobacteriia bacterium]|nr:tetratricopeptide repeat protein [Terriglobia bacterium]
MRFLRNAVILLLLIPAAGLAQKKEIQDLQRDFGLLQMDVRTLQRSFDEKIAAISVLLQQTLDSANKSNTSIALLEREVKERLREQEKTVAGPVAGLSAKIDTMTDEFRFVKESVGEMSARLNRIQAQIVEMDTAIKTLNAPPAPPPGSAPGPAPGGAPAGASPTTLFDNAMRDKIAGKHDIAILQFNDYLKWFPNTDQACEAQFHIGEIHANKVELEPAIQAFDAVLEKYPSTCSKVPDAQFMKGRALARSGQRTAAATEFRELLKKYPTGEWATKANAELKILGFSTASPASSRKRR